MLVLPEWWGLNDFAIERARRLAALGFSALAVDLYGDGRVAADAAEAGAVSYTHLDVYKRQSTCSLNIDLRNTNT